jgi:uroporphyrinogen decarboxylase
MDSKERFHATLNHEKVDRNASWLGAPEEKAIPQLLKYFQVGTIEELKLKIDDDIWPVEVPFNLAPNYHIAGAFDFAKVEPGSGNNERTLTAPGFFMDYSLPGDIDKFDWPDPKKYLDKEESHRRVKAIPSGKIKMGMMWSAHFQDACSAFGMENALMAMLMNPEMFRAVINRIVDFYLRANELFYEATKGYLDAVLIGNDFGSQTGLMVEPATLREFVFEGTKKLIDQAKSYNLKVIHHSCGSIIDIIPDLIELGADCIHPIQALATNMQPQILKERFYKQVSFCGGVDAQELLVNGTAREVKQKVRELKEIFPTGLIISPSHEAILADIPPANVEAIFQAVAEKK